MLYSVAGVTDSFSSYESYYMSGTSDTEYSSESGSVEAVGSYYQYDVSITYCFVTLYVHLKQPAQLNETYHASLVVPFLRTNYFKNSFSYSGTTIWNIQPYGD